MPKKLIGARFFIAAAAALIVSIIISGPRRGPAGGPIYDFLLQMRAPVPEAREILLVEADPAGGAFPPGAADMAETLLMLVEMEAGHAVLDVPIAEGPVRGGQKTERSRAVARHFDEEFGLIEKNIRTLFEAIRLGSVRPRDSSRYVGDLIALIDEGKGRLLSETLNTEDAGAVFFERAKAVFGKVWTAEPDSRYRRNGGGHSIRTVPVIRDGPDESVQADFSALLDRIGARNFEFRGNRLVIPGARLPGREKDDLSIPINPDGSLQIEQPRPSGGAPPFRRLEWNTLLRYAELEKELHHEFARMERAGYFNEIGPETYPTILYEHARSEREDLLADPEGRKADRWRRSRDRYLTAARDFLFGKTEENLVSGYDGLISSETLDDGGTLRVTELRDAVLRDFSRSRDLYTELFLLRGRIETALRGSFCIFGSDVEASALLVNSILTGRYIESVYGYRYTLLSFFPNLVLAGLLAPLGTLLTLAAGLAAAVIMGSAAAAAFLAAGVWIDPAGPLAVLTAATFVSVMVPVCASRSRPRAAGGPPPGEVCSAVAAVVAVRHTGAPDAESFRDRVRRARVRRDFREKTGRDLVRAGGIVIGVDGAVVLAAFGAPRDTAGSDKGPKAPPEDHVRQACKAVLDMIGADTYADDGRHYGIDIGECVFFHSEFGGPAAVGSPLVHARMLSGLAMKHKCRVLVTRKVKDAAGQRWRTRRFNASAERGGK
jgi:hypothetical protein